VPNDPAVRRWVGALRADRASLLSAALLYPGATFVHVARDVDATVAAQLETQDDADVEDLYEAWLAATHAILDLTQMLDARRVHTVGYDELLQTPDAAIRRCLETIGEEHDPACVALFAGFGARTTPAGTSSIPDLPGIPAQLEARRLSVALSGKPASAPETERTSLMAKVLAHDTGDTGRRRRATDVDGDDRNPYAASHDLVRRYAPKSAVVCVVSKGDEMAVRIRGHSLGWHFPQTADGAYAGYHPTDAREAIAHLEHLRDRGAQLFLVPKPYTWWLTHYAELRLHLERSYRRVPSSEDEGVLFDLRVGSRPGPATPGGV
jgi:hypothetical protein